MNRVLKFRCWDKINKKFIPPSRIAVSGNGILLITNSGMYENFENQNYFDSDIDYVVQQFAGLYDKNDNPIYEGDRVRFSYIENEYFFGEVVWLEDRASFGVRYENITETFEDLGFVQKYFEVVGNIFKLPCNPDHNGECLICDKPLDGCPFNKERTTKS
jgi:hypothetical protein